MQVRSNREWQWLPEVWTSARSPHDDHAPGRFLLTGPRIVRSTMSPPIRQTTLAPFACSVCAGACLAMSYESASCATSDLFVGREPELAVLASEWAVVCSGTPRVVRVTGEAGIGKTALLGALASRLAPKGRTVAVRADEGEQHAEFAVVGQVLSEQLSGGQDALVVGASLVGWMGGAAEAAPLLLVVDDAHWIDVSSLRALVFGLRRLSVDRVLAVFASRSDEDEWHAGALSRLATDRGQTLRLEGLDVRQVTVLAEATGHGHVRLRAAERLRTHTGGSPLHLRALLSELSAADLGSMPGELPAPNSFGLLVLGGLAEMSAQAQDLARAAAVLGPECPVSHGALLAGLEDPAPAIEELQRARFLRPRLGALGWSLQWIHPLVRSAVYNDIGAAERGSLHRRAAAQLSGMPALNHLVAASMGPDDALAGELDVEAERELLAGRPREAADLLLSAYRLSASSAAGGERLLRAIGLLLLCGDVATALPFADALEALPESAASAHASAKLAWLCGRAAEARDRGDHAWRLTSDRDDELRSGIAALMSQLCILAGEEDEAYQWADRALAGHGLTIRERSALQALAALSLVLNGRPDQAMARLSELSEESESVRLELHDQLRARGHVRLVTDNLEGALADFLAVGAALHRDFTPGRLAALAAASEAEYRRGDWDASLAHGEHAVSLAEDCEQGWLGAFVQCMPVLVLAATGQWVAAEQHLQRAEPLARLIGDEASMAYVRDAQAHLAACRSQPEAVVHYSAPLMSGAHAVPREPGVLRWPVHFTSSLVALGRFDEAEAALEPLTARARSLRRESRLAGLARVRGELFAARGETGPARSAFQEASDLAAAADALERALGAMAFGRFLRRRGERRAALERLISAREQLTALGAVPFLALCEAELVLAGAPSQLPSKVADPLTPRERLVAGLVCAGRTNREIADELVLSVKTVGYHLGNVYTKLDVHSRTQLAGHSVMRAGTAR
jgi:DNA-binding CsgD family transcriptional regulator